MPEDFYSESWNHLLLEVTSLQSQMVYTSAGILKVNCYFLYPSSLLLTI